MTLLQICKPDCFLLATNLEQMRDTPEYEQIRSEINRRISRVLGGPNWSKIARLCEQQASSGGIDLLIATYYTVAAIKTRGIPGLADGLELQATILRQRSSATEMPAHKRAELYRWMLGMIGDDLRTLQTEPVTSRDLYRCERSIQAIYTCLHELQADNMPDIEALGFTISERIAQMERALGTRDIQIIERTPPQRKIRLSIFFAGLLIGVLFWLSWFLIDGYQPAVLKELSIASETPTTLSLLESEILIDKFGSDKINRQKNYLIPLYSQQIEKLMATSDSDHLFDIVQLTDSLKYLYPDSAAVINLKQHVENWRAQLNDIMELQSKRFETARTRAANISQTSKIEDFSDLSPLAQGLENYAISLSPLLGRVTYIETLINEGQIDIAEKESEILNMRIKALLLKHGELRAIIQKNKITQ